MHSMTHDFNKDLDRISRCWGPNKGYVSFPRITDPLGLEGDRGGSWEEHSFKWPEERDNILELLRESWDNDYDQYFCPNVFYEKYRRRETVKPEYCLYADMDDADLPGQDEEWEPTIAWESSPGRHQAVWLSPYPIEGATDPGGENQCLTYFLGADKSGWDTSQVLRIPGWPNWKPEYQTGKGRKKVWGRLLWDDGPTWNPGYLAEKLPDVPVDDSVAKVMMGEVDDIKVKKTWTEKRLKVSKRVREMMDLPGNAEIPGGVDRSNALWEIERELADAGCTVAEIVALVQPSPWNKFRGRGNEFAQLVMEASKAWNQREVGRKELDEEDGGFPTSQRFKTIFTNIPKPTWLVQGIWTEGSCGFIAGEPKMHKSWMGLDLAISVATGLPFLGEEQFEVKKQGPVLYIQEEDALPTLANRAKLVMKSKGLSLSKDDIDVSAIVRANLVLSDTDTIDFLDEELTKGCPGNESPYRLMILDPLLMMAGQVDENRASDMMTKVFKPLTQLSNKFNLAIAVIHHMVKQRTGAGNYARAGQRLHGSVAHHAWVDDALYLTPDRNSVQVEHESKFSPLTQFKVNGIRSGKGWAPKVAQLGDMWGPDPSGLEETTNGHKPERTENIRLGPVMQCLRTLRRGTTTQIAEQAGRSYQTTYKQLNRALDGEFIGKDGDEWIWLKNHTAQ